MAQAEADEMIIDVQDGELENEDDNDFMDINEIDFVELLPFHSTVLGGTRCAAHTLQLAIKDFFNIEQVKTLTEKGREMAVHLRKPSFIRILRTLKKKMPILDCPTRWGSTYLMLVRLQEYQEISEDIEFEDEGFFERTSILISALKPVEILNRRLQSEVLLLSDFFSQWIKTKLELERSTNTFTNSLLSAMKNREAKLFDNDVLLAGVFLDPRFKSLLTPEQKTQAEAYVRIFIDAQSSISQAVSFLS